MLCNFDVPSENLHWCADELTNTLLMKKNLVCVKGPEIIIGIKFNTSRLGRQQYLIVYSTYFVDFFFIVPFSLHCIVIS